MKPRSRLSVDDANGARLGGAAPWSAALQAVSPPGVHSDRRVAVMLAVYNGSAFLADQIATLADQTVAKLDIWASDDNSTDASRDLLESAAAGWIKGSFAIFEGPQAGFAENFRSLIAATPAEADYFAFCDQDDLWDADKLEAALDWLESCDPNLPALYCTRTITMTEDGRVVGSSPLFPKPPSFRNAIVQSIAGANTMVLNRKAFELVREASRRTSFISHDWWCYLIVSGAGGAVRYSPEARIRYRQHVGNLVGENNSWRARMLRLGALIGGRFVRWNSANLAALGLCRDLLSPDSVTVCERFSAARSGRLGARLAMLRRSGVYRQTHAGQLGLFLACVLRRF